MVARQLLSSLGTPQCHATMANVMRETQAPPNQAQQYKRLQDRVAWGPALLSASLAIVLYAVTLCGGYIYDDRTIVVNDERMHDVHQWSQLWTQAYFPGGIDHLYRPLISSSYAVQWWAHGDRPWIFHLVNVLTHALAAAGVAEFTRRALALHPSAEQKALTASAPIIKAPIVTGPIVTGPIVTGPIVTRSIITATIAGSLFAAHPIHVEAVANIVGRAELASTAFIFLGLILLCKSPLTYSRVCAVVAIGMAAVLCKEQGILQPLLWFFLLLIVIPKTAAATKKAVVDEQAWLSGANQDTGPSPLAGSPRKAFLLSTTWIWAGYLFLREHYLRFEWDRSFMDPTFQPLMLSTGLDRILMPVVLLGHYTALLIWPAHLSLDYGGDVIGHRVHLNDPYLWIGVVAVTLWLTATVRCIVSSSRSNRFFLFCLLSLAVTYGMVGNIVTLIGTNFAERLMYLPSAFLAIIVALLLRALPGRPRLATTAAVLLLASLRTATAAHDWNNPVDLFKSSLAAQPRSIQAHLLLAEQYEMQRNYPAAADVLKQACDLYPNYWRVWQFRCEEAIAAGDFPDAEKSLKRAVVLDHNPVTAALQGELTKAQAASRP
jgi:hypothetical protein